MFKNGWFYVVAVLLLSIIVGSIYHQCSISELKKNNETLLRQLLNDSNYQTKQLTETISGIKTIETNQMSPDILSEELKKQLEKHNLNAIYASQISIQASLSKIIEGQAGSTTAIPRDNTSSQPTTIIVRTPTNDNSSSVSCSRTDNVPSDNQPSSETVSACNECLANNIIRVPFSHTEEFLHAEGYTDSGNALGATGSYRLSVDWIKDVSLSIALTQNESGDWDTLIDSNDPDVQISRIRSEINISPFEQRWWQRIKLGGSIGFGESGALTGASIGYQLPHIAILGSWWYEFPFSGVVSYNEGAFYGVTLLGNF